MSEPKPKSPSAIRYIIDSIVLLGVLALLIAIIIPNFVGPRRSGPAWDRNTCINNLRQIDSAKQEWALENHKNTSDIPTVAEVAALLKNNRFPVCPAGGKYTIGRVADYPTCSIPGHVLPPP